MTDLVHGQNSSFSLDIPGLQIAWDSTSMGALKECPRKYQLSIMEGWQPRTQSVHLTFGLHYHAALERYDHSRAQGESHEQAQRDAVLCALIDSWDPILRKPWFSDHPQKNRLTLLRSIVWYLEQFSEDTFETVILSNGKPAVELSFRLELDYVAPTGENFILCGHLDRLAKLGDEVFILDRKTTSSTISPDFFRKFSPDNQFSTYLFAGSVIYQHPINRIVVDGVQVAVTFSRFQRGIVDRHSDQTIEWLRDMGFWLGQATVFAQQGYWPMNDKSCGNYGGCQFRGICSKPKAVRAQWLSAEFTRRTWDPLQVRGDI